MGKTDRCRQKFGEHPNVLIRHTDKGCTMDSLVPELIDWLTMTVTEVVPCCLIIDVYAGQVSLHVWQTAADNCVELLIVPAGATGRLQPRDCRIFGRLKARVLAEFNRIAMTPGTMTVG
jgi:hypothetical protein